MFRARLWPVFVAAMVVAAPLRAQEAPQSALSAESVRALLARIDALEKRVAELESAARAGAAPAVTPAPVLPTEHPELAAPAAQQEYPFMKLRGFSDVTFASRDVRTTDDGFRMGQFIMHLSSALSPRISFVGETSFTAQQTGFALDVERAFIRYSYNDHLKLSFGRYHTPTSYWNTAYHHGLWLQTSVGRPDMIQFGGRVQPVHFVGLLVEGSIPSGGLGLGYSAGLGNGRGVNLARAGDAGDVNGHRAWLVNVQSRPPAIHGLQAGGAVYVDRISASGLDVDERIASVHVALTRERPEIIAEWADARHSTAAAPASSTRAYYVQLAYRLPQLGETLKPYYRFDRIETPAADPLLDPRNLFANTFGLRYDISHYAALKGEYRRSRERRGEPYANAFLAQTSFVF